MLSSSLVQISRSNLLTTTGRFIGAPVLVFAMSLIAVVSPSSSVSAKTGKVWRALSHRIESQSFVLYQNELGAAVCRKATEVEHQQITERSGGGATELIYSGAPLRSQMPYGAATWTSDAAPGLLLQPSAGLRIVLHGTAQLNQNQTAKNAFIVAANRWEAIISTPITVVIDVDFGPTFFGTPYPDASILGATGVDTLIGPYTDLRQRLINSATATAEQQLHR